ncbi:MAG TPA: DUF3352 domain-containing protein [Actinomycetota bacterium]|nr:DUF3352 domain-containing protein [Actinomycetota bacterium]
MRAKVVVGLIAAALVVGGGAFALTRFMAPAEDAAIEYVPSDAVGYMNVFVRPSNDQKRALDSLLQKFPGIDSTDEAIEKLTDLLDEGLAEGGMSYEEDLEPWLGDQVAAFLTPGGTPELPNFAFLVESKNDGAAGDFVEKLAEEDGVVLEDVTYEGETYQMEEDADEPIAVAILDGFLVGGTEDAIKDVIDTRAGDETLAGDADYVEATEPLEDDWIGLFYFDFAGFLSAYGETAGYGPQEQAALEAFGLDQEGSQAAILYASSNSITFESSGGFGLGGQFGELTELVAAEGILPDLPGGTWAAYGIPNFGALFDGLFDVFKEIPGFDREQIDAMFYGQTGLRLQEDVLSWMEDAGLFVQGTSIRDVGGGLVIESNDPAKTARLLERLEELVTQQGIETKPESAGDLEGFSVLLPGVPAPIYALGGDRLVVGYGDAALDAASGEGGTLRDSEAFAAAQEAVGEDFDISFYVDVDGAQAFGEAVAAFSGASMETYEQDAKPYVDVLTHVIAAAKMEGDTIVQKFVVGVE